ncbi:hypothetical protein BURKHO8Y_70091 [Burkholderia sp. 8Y]|nr:hypothetical protein BURKHO8Y_70091 [Burkholderia sp. 8Y]
MLHCGPRLTRNIAAYEIPGHVAELPVRRKKASFHIGRIHFAVSNARVRRLNLRRIFLREYGGFLWRTCW